MVTHLWKSIQISKLIFVGLALAFSGIWISWVNEGGGSQAWAQTPAKIEATIFTLEGQDFVRSQTTLVTEDGKSAVSTKLDHKSPAYKALMKKHSYSGEATLFGKKYDAHYAPLTGADGKLKGALFVAVLKQ